MYRYGCKKNDHTKLPIYPNETNYTDVDGIVVTFVSDEEM